MYVTREPFLTLVVRADRGRADLTFKDNGCFAEHKFTLSTK